MNSATLNINHLLEDLDEKDYDRAVSYIKFLIDSRKKEKIKNMTSKEPEADVETLVASLVGIIPDTGKSLEEYRNERLRKYENID